jgi:integrase
MRDRALLAVLVACALRRGELSRMNCEHLVMRDGRWVFLDFKGKGNKTRSVTVPLWVKQEIDGWLDVAGIEYRPSGCLPRPDHLQGLHAAQEDA